LPYVKCKGGDNIKEEFSKVFELENKIKERIKILKAPSFTKELKKII
jgi:hypothetical protein